MDWDRDIENANANSPRSSSSILAYTELHHHAPSDRFDARYLRAPGIVRHRGGSPGRLRSGSRKRRELAVVDDDEQIEIWPLPQ